jgi:murein DD-endopeptidase MepM/ murein hydrolase activator NlpD
MKKFSTEQEKKWFSFVIIPPSGKKSLSLRIPVWGFYSAIVFLVILFFLFIFSVILTLQTSVRLTKYQQVKQISNEQQKEIQQFNVKTNELLEEIKRLFEQEEEIQLELGSSTRKKTKRTKRSRRKKRIKKSSSYIFMKKYEKVVKEGDTEKVYVFLKGEVSKLKKKFNRTFQKAIHNRNRFASTPSIWPVYGRIRSGYGIRYHPIRGRKIFHKGLDIPAWKGAPVKAAAEGIVSYSGWSKGGFGFIVIVAHDYGYRTIYAHCSQVLVRRRQLVKKGQVIAQVGSTGLSTGSHLHYEIQRWRRAIDPNPYLDLDMFTASTRIW